MNAYKILKQQRYTQNEFSIVPIRFEDRYEIMQWRNEQVYHLRQNGLLSEQQQDEYFDNVVSKLFDQDEPDQILFSFLNGQKCIGYGGLVHVNWVDKNAEISFIMDTKLEKSFFDEYWTAYSKLIEKVAFEKLNLHKIFVYAFDLRPHLYKTLNKNHYFHDATLEEHCYFRGEYKNVIIYAKLNQEN